MRLNDDQVHTIVHAVLSRFGDAARVYLFGSRVDDAARGGDIDLLVELPESDQQMVRHACQAVADMQMALGEQKIDLLIKHPNSVDQPIFHEAMERGVLLS